MTDHSASKESVGSYVAAAIGQSEPSETPPSLSNVPSTTSKGMSGDTSWAIEQYDSAAQEEAVRAMLDAFGLGGEHFEDTPRRFVELVRAFTRPIDLAEVLERDFTSVEDNYMVTQVSIPFAGLCAHHLAPFWGSAAVGYLPRGRIVGISKITRLVMAAGRNTPTTQEAITHAIANTMFKHQRLQPSGVAVVTRAGHGCMAVRGPKAPLTETIVSTMRGTFAHSPQTRQEFMDMVTW